MDQKSMDQKSMDQKSMDQKSMDQKSMDQKSMDQNRVEQFKAEISDMRLKIGGSGSEQGLQVLGAVLMVVGVVVGVLSYVSATNQSDVRDQNELVILTLAMVGLTVLGAAVFLRYSLAKFLRLWLLRQSYEAQSHIDQIVEAVRR